jgi:hypothetical protein
MNRAPFALVDSRGRTIRLSGLRNQHQRKGASHDLHRIGWQWQEYCGTR